MYMQNGVYMDTNNKFNESSNNDENLQNNDSSTDNHVDDEGKTWL